MPTLTCGHGCEMRIGTDEWLATLTVDQLRHARAKADEKIKKAEEQPRRIVWRVSVGGWVDGNYREEDYEKAAEHLLRIFKDRFTKEAQDFIDEPYGPRQFADEIPHVFPARVTQLEYETEWFPEKPPA